jgi:hypothetical protein
LRNGRLAVDGVSDRRGVSRAVDDGPRHENALILRPRPLEIRDGDPTAPPRLDDPQNIRTAQRADLTLPLHVLLFFAH